MTKMAGEVADGMMSHPTHSSARYLKDVTLPGIADGARRRGRSADLCPVLAAGFIITGPDESALGRVRDQIREQFSFLYSTRAYWRALDHVGFAHVGRKLHELAKQSRWNEMATEVSDELIEALVPQACYAEIAPKLIAEYGRLVKRVTFPVPQDSDEDEQVTEVLAALRKG
jgi:alkanesulfonate monooxygenase SsuD/methylene tetrahydromethanopterin reductase-like flavin-dependent oxidoreductase (luciferase family)